MQGDNSQPCSGIFEGDTKMLSRIQTQERTKYAGRVTHTPAPALCNPQAGKERYAVFFTVYRSQLLFEDAPN